MPGRTFRFRRPSFLGGMARVLDLTGGDFCLERPGRTAAERDALALANDWARVGGDLRQAFQRVAPDVDRARRAHGHDTGAR
ncbi:MAG TPA: hypothetical protein VFJ16_06200 [Longimicrobium sp.]|nr:hypothetical protein [Longimicrobium sp.]